MSAQRFSHPTLASSHDPAGLVTDPVPASAHQGGQSPAANQAERQHRAWYPPNATGVSHTRTASASPPAAATAGERLSCTQRANTSTVTASAPADRISSRLRPSTRLV